MASHTPNPERYEQMAYRRCGSSGLKLPLISLGLWHNFGGVDDFEKGRECILSAFDQGIVHFDLANNYGPPPGSAEENFGQVLKGNLKPHRDELVISTKAGYEMWDGPYGNWGSRKSLISSLDQSLRRMGLDYVDIFYSHRPDPKTPLEETMGALDFAVRSGRALYVGISSYSPTQTREAARILRELGTPCLIHQPRYSMFDRTIEQNGLLTTLEAEGIGCIAFSPLAQGVLTEKYLDGIPAGSRATKPESFLKREAITSEKIAKVEKLRGIARDRGQSMAQLALTWVCRHPQITSVLIGASNTSQIEEAVDITKNLDLGDQEMQAIAKILAE